MSTSWRLVVWAAFLMAIACCCAHAQTTPLVVANPVQCATSVDGSVVGLPNPLNPPVVAAVFSGTLPAGNYWTEIGWYDAAGHVTLVGPEVQTQLSGTGSLQVSVPTSGMPAAAVGMDVYIGTSSGGETLQGTTTGPAAFTQSATLTTGMAVPSANTTVCNLVANDAGWPTGTGYVVGMQSPSGAVQPGYPLQAQFIGPGTQVNVGQGFPQYSGTVLYPIPLLARPYNHAQQSVSGPLSMTGYAITQVLKLGVGTSVPAWPVDVENGAVNASGGFIYNGGVGVVTGNCLIAGSDTYKTFVPGACATLPAIFYQQVTGNGSAFPARVILNFDSTLAVSDNFGTQATTVGLPSIGAVGTCNTPLTLTIDAQGRVTNTSCLPSTAVTYDFSFTSCTIGTGSPSYCNATINFTTSATPTHAALADANYTVECVPNMTDGYLETTGANLSFNFSAPLTTTGFTYNIAASAVSPSSSHTMIVYCHLHHS